MNDDAKRKPVGKANDDGHDLYRWMQNGFEWACCAYDHGPLCRRCRPVRMQSSILDLVQAGTVQMWDRDRGGWKFERRPVDGREDDL